MFLKYPSISSSYVDQSSESSPPLKTKTLNSMILNHLLKEYFENSENFEVKKLVFPQRIPRLGFFRELASVEGPHFKERHQGLLEQLARDLKEKLTQYFNSKKPPSQNRADKLLQQSIYIGKLLIRLGGSLEIAKLFSSIDPSEKPRLCFELSLLWSLSLNQLRIDEDAQINDHHLENEPLIAFLKSFPQSLDFVNAVIRLIIQYSRYPNQKVKNGIQEYLSPEIYEQILSTLSQKHSKISSTTISNPINDLVNLSSQWRGFAMWPGIALEKQREFVQYALQEIKNINPKTIHDQNIRDEILYTSLQTVAKTPSLAPDDRQGTHAEDTFKEMIQLDPLDSTAWSELGLYYFHNHKISESEKCFMKAVELGPPAYAMNAYFLAETLAQKGDKTSAIQYCLESSKHDPLGVSSLLLLIKITEKDTDNDLRRNAIIKLKTDLKLNEQLSPEEREWIQNEK